MKKSVRLILLYILIFESGISQSVSLYRSQEMSHLADRYAVITGDTAVDSDTREIRRDQVAAMAENIQPENKVDKYNRYLLLSSNAEYTDDSTVLSDAGRVFFKNRAEFFGVHQKGIDLVLEPILNFGMSGSNYSPERRIFYNKRGFRARGIIGGKVAFQTELADVQERGTHQFEFLRAKYNNTVNGAGFFNNFKSSVDPYGVDYMDTRSTINFNLLKNYIDLTAGFGKNFIGDGYRSLFLSQNSNNYLYVKLNVNFWRLHYQSITAELMPYKPITGQVAPRKYFVNNYLTIDITDNLSFGFFEGVVMRRKERFDIIYAVPLIFLRAIERNVGSPDNAVVGGSAKWNIKNTAQLYGQLMFDEFILSDLKGSKSWTNKFGFQLGGKYFNMFGIKNLDVQAETNWVRPFSYQHNTDSGDVKPIESYTHYDQALAHPLGAGFQEYAVILRYQPLPKLFFTFTGIFYNQGLDSAGVNTGNNPLEDYRYRNKSDGIDYVNGPNMSVNYFDFDASYFFLPGISLDGSFTLRQQTSVEAGNLNDYYFTLGLRFNTFKRKYDY